MPKLSVAATKAKYPAGTRIRLGRMLDDHAVPDGMTGSVDMVDDLGQIHMLWDNGRTLAIIPEIDSFEVID